ncbi:protein hinderin [Spea bombifrons]|uniref:protein hinderin n=1 Tax=Spea bombifrons TaxID=233779 RepID=UPI00234A9655|nr:protein hinderin [Spea bombifrons]
MADVAGEGAAGYWSLDASDDDQPAVYIPGLSREGNLRRVPKFKTEASRPKGRTPSPADIVNLVQSFQREQEQQAAREDGGAQSASLKDLCPEDKRRIANLIKELARVSEEKEVTEERLKMEHKSFEKKIRRLEDENNLIAAERETLQQQYQECQEMLNLYQRYLSEQQEKLTGAGGRDSQQMPKSFRKPTSGELNGSYLHRSCQKPGSDSESSCSLVAKRHCGTPAAPSKTPFRCDPAECCLENHLERRCSSVVLPERSSAQNFHPCSSQALEPTARCCLRCTTHDGPADLAFGGPTDSCAFVGPSPAPDSQSGGGGVVAASGKRLTEERRHELLLQKMELEVRKEQLQQMLAQQELKLLEKQRQLQRSRLEYNRTPPPSETPLLRTNDIPRASAETAALANGVHSPVKPPSERVSTPSSSGISKKLRRSGGGSTGKRAPPSFSGSERDAGRVSRRDAATSPTVSVEPTPRIRPGNSPGHHDVCRYETSLIEMLEAVSPISMRSQQPACRDLRDFSFLSPVPRSRYKPPSHPTVPAVRAQQQHAEDPEESRLLEDIFFIC